ncbi:MAG: cation:proton antiporter [Lewinellaceae bacterium]|nr:cation:proton antiporter [Lewinellaceae bacterium]
MSSSFLIQALVFIGAAIVFVPFAKKLGLSSIIGYLLAGIIIGPFGLGFVGENGQDLMHAAEFGVVMMLFLIGLELDPKAFWEMRKSITGLGLSQMLGTTLLLFPIMLTLQWSWQSALAIALAFSMSSTAIVLQTLKEKQLSRSTAGEASFSVLLFQDIAVIPILALLPLLGNIDPATTQTDAHGSLMEGQPAWLQGLSVVLAVGLILLAGRFLVVPFLRYVSKSGLRELLTASSLFVVIGVATLMQVVGLSPALGAFLAGVVLANSEFRHELESNVEPFKGLLLGLFFVSVGSTIDFNQIKNDPVTIAMLAALVLAVKFVVLFVIGRFSKMGRDQNLLFSLGLSQIGEFGFVLLSFIGQINIIDPAMNAKLMAVVAITMATTPFLLLINDKWILPYFGIPKAADKPEADTIDQRNKVILAGFGHFGNTIGRLLRANGIEATIVDSDPDRVELLRNMGFKVYYGDATRLELLKSAGLEEATLLIAAIDSPETNNFLISRVREHFPHLKIMARARNRNDAYELMDMGVHDVYRETLYTAVHLGVDALVHLGFRKYTANRQGQKFIQYDEKALVKLAAKRHDLKEYILSVKEEIEWEEQLLLNDLNIHSEMNDQSWDSEHVREVIKQSEVRSH